MIHFMSFALYVLIATTMVSDGLAAVISSLSKEVPATLDTASAIPTDLGNESGSSNEEKSSGVSLVIPEVSALGRDDAQLNPGEIESEPEKVTLPPVAAASPEPETEPHVEVPAETDDSSSSSSSSSSEESWYFSSSSEEYLKKKKIPK